MRRLLSITTTTTRTTRTTTTLFHGLLVFALLLLLPRLSIQIQDDFDFAITASVDENDIPHEDSSEAGGRPNTLKKVQGLFKQQKNESDFVIPVTYLEKVTCFIENGNACDADTTDSFRVENLTPDVNNQFLTWIMMDKPLDREIVGNKIRLYPNVTYQLKGQDKVSKEGLISIDVVDENDNSPLCDTNCQQGVTKTLPENNDTQQLFKVQMTDPDFKEFGEITYSIIKVEAEKGKMRTQLQTNFVSINPSSGEVRNTQNLDFEVMDKVIVEVQAKDGGLDSGKNKQRETLLELTLTLTDVNDNPPVFIGNTPSGISVSESASIGDVVLVIQVNDPDATANLTFSLNNPAFEIKEGGGGGGRRSPKEVQLVVAQELDYETAPTQEVEVVVSDGSFSANRVYSIAVDDVNDAPPVVSIDDLAVDAEAPKDTQVGKITLEDPDGGSPFAVSITGDAPFENVFAIRDGDDENQKLIVVSAEKLPETEAGKKVVLRVKACDKSGNCGNTESFVTVRATGVRVGALGLPAFIAIVVCLFILLLLLLLLILLTRRRRRNKEKQLVEDGIEYEENFCYVEEGAEELDNDNFDISTLRKPISSDPSLILDPSKYALPNNNNYTSDPHLGQPPNHREQPIQHLQQAPMFQEMSPSQLQHQQQPQWKQQQQQQQQQPNNLEDVNDFIHSRLREAYEDPASPPFDTIMEFNNEGAGSLAGSLSSISSCGRNDDQNFEHLREWGPRFSKLADMYGDGSDSEDEERPPTGSRENSSSSAGSEQKNTSYSPPSQFNSLSSNNDINYYS